MKYFISQSAEQTAELGRKIGAFLLPDEIIGLAGPLGAGKTTLIQGIAEGMNVKDYLTSPTFILINEYQGRIPLFHIDLYRIEDLSEIEDLGIEEYFSRGGVCLIEWVERMELLFPERAEKIEIERISENERKIILPPNLAFRFA